MGPKNVLHRTGFRGHLPMFHSHSQMISPFMNRGPHFINLANDFDPHMNGMLGHSENIFNKLEHMMENDIQHSMHIDDVESEHHNNRYKHKSDHQHGGNHHEHEVKKMKMDHEMDKIA